jgi:predicted nucleotidyltransferase
MLIIFSDLFWLGWYERMNEISDQIKQIIEIIINDYKPDKVILFGSRARGDDRPDSDIDILAK